jgi:hypothetical protein
MTVRALILSVAAFLGCSRGSATRGLKDPSAMKIAVQRIVPTGTSLAQARDAMESEGFKVAAKQNAMFSEEGKVHKNIDYLYCDRTELAAFPVERRWQVALVNDGTQVTDILVSMGLTGP